MVQFILTTILMASLGTMLYLVARSLPRVGEEVSDKKSFLDRLSSSEIPERIDTTFNVFLLKYLRKLKVVLLKVDNFITEKLKKISSDGNLKHFGKLTSKPKIDLKDINGDSTPKSDEKNPSSESN